MMPQLMPLMWMMSTIMILYIFMVLINLYSYIEMNDLESSFSNENNMELVNMSW